jgi:hypothetical protein
MDRLFLSKESQIVEPTDKNLTLYQFSCILLSSKSDELDENIPQIKDLGRYYTKILPTQR